MHSGSLNHIYASLASCIMCVQVPFHAHNINSFALLSLSPQWLYMHSGSLNHIYASLASCIMCVQAPFHAYNINSFAFSLSLSFMALYAFRLSEPYICQLSSVALCVFRPPFTHIISTASPSSLSLVTG